MDGTQKATSKPISIRRPPAPITVTLPASPQFRLRTVRVLTPPGEGPLKEGALIFTMDD